MSLNLMHWKSKNQQEAKRGGGTKRMANKESEFGNSFTRRLKIVMGECESAQRRKQVNMILSAEGGLREPSSLGRKRSKLFVKQESPTGYVSMWYIPWVTLDSLAPLLSSTNLGLTGPC